MFTLQELLVIKSYLMDVLLVVCVLIFLMVCFNWNKLFGVSKDDVAEVDKNQKK